MTKHPRYSFWQSPLLVFLEIGACAVVGSAILYPVFAPTKVTCEGRGTYPLPAVKQIATAVTIYTLDYDETFPPVQTQDDFKTLLHPYSKNDYLFEVAKDRQTNYIFNTNLSAVKTQNIPSPDQTILIYTPLAKTDRDPVSEFIVSYAALHIETIPLQDWPTKRQSLDWLFPRESEEFLTIP